MTGETREARRLLADNWAYPAPDCANTAPGIAFLGLLADLLDGGLGTDAIGRLKRLLLDRSCRGKRASPIRGMWGTC